MTDDEEREISGGTGLVLGRGRPMSTPDDLLKNLFGLAVRHATTTDTGCECGAWAEYECGCGKYASVTTLRDEYLMAHMEAAIYAMWDLAEWHETKADKAVRFPGQDQGREAEMVKAAQVHEDAARRIRDTLKRVLGGADD